MKKNIKNDLEELEISLNRFKEKIQKLTSNFDEKNNKKTKNSDKTKALLSEMNQWIDLKITNNKESKLNALQFLEKTNDISAIKKCAKNIKFDMQSKESDIENIKKLYFKKTKDGSIFDEKIDEEKSPKVKNEINFSSFDPVKKIITSLKK